MDGVAGRGLGEKRRVMMMMTMVRSERVRLVGLRAEFLNNSIFLCVRSASFFQKYDFMKF